MKVQDCNELQFLKLVEVWKTAYKTGCYTFDYSNDADPRARILRAKSAMHYTKLKFRREPLKYSHLLPIAEACSMNICKDALQIRRKRFIQTRYAALLLAPDTQPDTVKSKVYAVMDAFNKVLTDA